MRKPTFPALLSAALVMGVAATLAPAPATAQVAGSTVTEVSVQRRLALGWSAKRQVIGRQVYSGTAEVLGTVEDLIVSPAEAVSYIIVNAGGPLQRHDVAVAVSLFSLVGDHLTLADTTRDDLKAAPPFHYN